MVWCRIMDCFVRRMILSHHPAATVMLYSGLLILSIAMVNASQSDTNWRDDKPLQQQRQLRDQSREQQHQDEEYGDDSSSAIAAEQQRIQAQEMAAYHKRLASLPLMEAQKLTQIDLKHSDSHVTAQVGHPAYLKCAVSNQGDQLVSWARRRDWHILTSGRHVFTADERFQILKPVEDHEQSLRPIPHQPNLTEWILQIQFVQQRDGGYYLCQVPTDLGLVSHQVQLEVLVPDVFILGPKDLIVDRGTTLSLVCIVENSPIPPDYVFWFHNDMLLNFQPKRDGVKVETDYGSRTHSKLEIKDANESDTGNYTCSTSSGKPYSIYVQVLAGDQAAAMSRKNSAQGHISFPGCAVGNQLTLAHLLVAVHLSLALIHIGR